MGRPLIGDRPLTAAEKVKRHRQKLRQMREKPPPSVDDLLAPAKHEILRLREENASLRAAVDDMAGDGLPRPAPASRVPATAPESAPAARLQLEVHTQPEPWQKAETAKVEPVGNSLWAIVQRGMQADEGDH